MRTRRVVGALSAILIVGAVNLPTAAKADPAPTAHTPSGVTVSGLSGFPLDQAGNLIDRAPMTKWSGPVVPASAAVPQWAQLTYAAPVTIGLVAVHSAQAFQGYPANIIDVPRTNGYEVHDVNVVASVGGVPVAAQAVTGNTADDIVFRFVPAVSADTVRINVTQATLSGLPANAILGEITAYPPALAGPEQARMADAVVDMPSFTTHWYAGDPGNQNDEAWAHFDTPWANGNPSLLDRLVDGGFRHIRDEFPGNPGLAERTAAKFATLGNNGVRSTLIFDPLQGTAPTAADCAQPGCATVGELLRMVDATADPSKPFPVEMVENPNETDARGNWTYKSQPFPAGTIAYNNDLYDALRNDPDPRFAALPLLSPAMAFAPNSASLGSLAPKCDAINLHQYSGDDVPDYSMEYGYSNGQGALSYIRPTCPGADIYPTETGYQHQRESGSGQLTPWIGVTEGAFGKYAPRLVLDYFNMGLKRATFYDLVDSAQSYGLIANDGRAYPAYTSLKNMNTVLADPGPSFAPGSLDYTITGGSPFTLKHTLLQKRNGDFYLALWLNAVSVNTDVLGIRSDRDTSQTITLTLNESVAQAEVYLPGASDAPTATYADPTTLTLDVPDQVMLVRLTPGGPIAVVPELSGAPALPVAALIAVGAPLVFLRRRRHGRGLVPTI